MVNKYKSIKPLIIGVGLAGKRHLEAQLSLGIQTGVYTTNPQTAKSLRGNENVIIFDNLKEGMDWSNLVHVCTPDDKHTEFVEMAIKKGKTVLCEKAFTTDLSEALYLQILAHKNKSIVIIGQNYRLTPTFLETRNKTLEGVLGTIFKIETTYLHDMTKYRLENISRNTQDFLYVGGSHAIDLACFILNDRVISVMATVGKKIRSEYKSQERYKIILKFASGVLGYIRLDASSPRLLNGTDLLVEGENGQLTSHNKIDKLLFHKKGDKKNIVIKLPNLETLTTPIEVKLVNNYLMGKIQSPWPLPEIDEAVSIIKILDAIDKAVSSGNEEYI